MKKSLLLAAVLSVAVMANAQYAHKAGSTATKAVATQTLKDVKIEKRTAQQATGQFAARPKKAVPGNSAYYLRPKGTMYSNWNSEGSGFIMPFIFTKPYDTVTWRNMSTAQGTPSWGYWLYSISNQARDSLTSNDYDLTVKYGYEYEDVPALTVGSSVYELSGYRVNRTTGAIESTATSGVASVPMAHEIYSSFENMLSTSHYYGSSNRFGEEMYGWTYYSGAPGPDYDESLPADQRDRSGYWFGKNYGDWNAFAVGFEKPVSPYVINNVYFWATAVSVTEDVDLQCSIYRLPELPQYNDTAAVQIGGDYLNDPANLIATGRTTITTDMNEDGSPILKFTLFETDPDLGLEYETTPEIEDAIVIVISGYDADAIQTLSGLITSDEEDEGVGEVCYVGAVDKETGTLLGLRGLNNFFTSGALKAGPSIFVEAVRPFITYNYDFETGEYTFPAAGGKVTYSDYGLEGISFFSYSPSADWYMTLVDGSDVPEWLHITLSDDYEDGEWAGTVQADVTCDALPAGTTGRTAVVRFAINGGYVDYKFIQGDGGPVMYTVTVEEADNGTVVADKTQAAEGETVTLTVTPEEGWELDALNVNAETLDLVIELDENNAFTMPADNVIVTATFKEAQTGVRGDLDGNGIVDIADVNIMIDMVLGKQDVTPAADLDGNGIVDIADVNILIDIVLGKA